jgi:hypothetical protein
MAGKREPDSPSELQIALDNRAFEIQLFWQRSNYFLVLMTALGVGAFTIANTFFALLISIFATISSVFWYRTNLGSKFWQESWEVEVVALAKRHNIESFNRPTDEIVEQVRASLQSGWSPRGKGRFRKYIDNRTLQKFSVTYYMILLSITSALVWSVVSVSYGYQLLFDTTKANASGLDHEEGRREPNRVSHPAVSEAEKAQIPLQVIPEKPLLPDADVSPTAARQAEPTADQEPSPEPLRE